MTNYLIRVAGHLSDELLTAFPLLSAQPQTVLRGELPNQAVLSDVLLRLDELGVQIVEVVYLPEHPGPSIRHGRTLT
ncbi:hypothetical protein ACIBSW_00065 [Actinoplanes sp. NPDC049668]|uniref:Uncharacterized protein n=1 Tax=Actinoplanes digitatis TaxID=1868 RepID=A0A7W7HTY2_9ACTN|nr:hypothetical protein [Actinoplanes digitatis]MBB4760664.1 hypothetical protein [Actinoplanes digitatis]BFE68853.1 hypothetical protein GCM10020092_021540 [Actinoplanes digitatis]GID94314.1 hypothetical protein Adi01nite_37260 [Actinoplanes digitatis]